MGKSELTIVGRILWQIRQDLEAKESTENLEQRN